MTHATKAIYKLLLTDYVKVSKVSVEDMLFDEQDIIRSMDKIEVYIHSFPLFLMFNVHLFYGCIFQLIWFQCCQICFEVISNVPLSFLTFNRLKTICSVMCLTAGY